MKHSTFITLLFCTCSIVCTAQELQPKPNSTNMTSTVNSKMDPGIEIALNAFIKGGDEVDIAKLESVLHPDYRSTINQFMGQEGVTILNRGTYLSMTRDGKIGGSPRTYQVVQYQSLGHTAHIQVHMESAKLIFDNFLSFVQDKAGKWWLINDAATAKPKP
jgi:Putative lumazine-binding